MTTEAILMLIVALVIVWGGLVLSILALRARPERADYPAGGYDDAGEEDAIVRHDT
ncbi:methionine/alanine import family NSS transporter small subunit [Isoptericola jiangsuensis]|uniref:methionine/alanine import family NSS transporter small subunit n=1 Tax=Isoptericola jiangsuensis TaxID=548579 RepID=UPI003AADB0F7